MRVNISMNSASHAGTIKIDILYKCLTPPMIAGSTNVTLTCNPYALSIPDIKVDSNATCADCVVGNLHLIV